MRDVAEGHEPNFTRYEQPVSNNFKPGFESAAHVWDVTRAPSRDVTGSTSQEDPVLTAAVETAKMKIAGFADDPELAYAFDQLTATQRADDEDALSAMSDLQGVIRNLGNPDATTSFVAPTVVLGVHGNHEDAEPDEWVLPNNVYGAFVPHDASKETNDKTNPEGGIIILSETLTQPGQETRLADFAMEELGEALGVYASEHIGMTVAEGDVGARLLKVSQYEPLADADFLEIVTDDKADGDGNDAVQTPDRVTVHHNDIEYDALAAAGEGNVVIGWKDLDPADSHEVWDEGVTLLTDYLWETASEIGTGTEIWASDIHAALLTLPAPAGGTVALEDVQQMALLIHPDNPQATFSESDLRALVDFGAIRFGTDGTGLVQDPSIDLTSVPATATAEGSAMATLVPVWAEWGVTEADWEAADAEATAILDLAGTTTLSQDNDAMGILSQHYGAPDDLARATNDLNVLFRVYGDGTPGAKTLDQEELTRAIADGVIPITTLSTHSIPNDSMVDGIIDWAIAARADPTNEAPISAAEFESALIAVSGDTNISFTAADITNLETEFGDGADANGTVTFTRAAINRVFETHAVYISAPGIESDGGSLHIDVELDQITADPTRVWTTEETHGHAGYAELYNTVDVSDTALAGDVVADINVVDYHDIDHSAVTIVEGGEDFEIVNGQLVYKVDASASTSNQVTLLTVDGAGNAVESTQALSSSPDLELGGDGMTILEREGLTEIEAEAPITAVTIHDVHTAATQILYGKLMAEPDGSDAKIAGNLIKAQIMNSLTMHGEVNMDLTQENLAPLMDLPEIEAMMEESVDEAVLQVYPDYDGVADASDALIADQVTFLTSPEVVTEAASLPEEQRQFFISDALHRIAYFDPTVAKTAFEDMSTLMVEEEMAPWEEGDFSGESADDVEKSIFDMLNTASNMTRFVPGAGLLANEALGNLTSDEIAAMANAMARYFTLPPNTRATMPEFLAEEASFAESTILNTTAFIQALEENGAMGSFWSVLAGFNLVYDSTHGPFDSVENGLQTVGDVMQLTAGTPSFIKFGTAVKEYFGAEVETVVAEQQTTSLFSYLGGRLETIPEETTSISDLGTLLKDETSTVDSVVTFMQSDADLMSAFEEIALDANPLLEGDLLSEQILRLQTQSAASAIEFRIASPTVFGEYIDNMVELSDAVGGGVSTFPEIDVEAFQDVATSVPLGNALVATPEEAAAAAEGANFGAEVSETEAERMGGAVGGIAGEGIAAGEDISADAARYGATVMESIGMLGTAANFLYAAKTGIASYKDFEEGDYIGGGLNGAASLGFTTAGYQGLKGTLLMDAEEAAWASAYASGAVIFTGVLLGADMLWEFEEADIEYEKNKAFLQSGVGDGVDYWYPPTLEIEEGEEEEPAP